MEELKIGDIITSYHAGYHVITKIEERTNRLGEPVNPLIYYKQLLSSEGKSKVFKKERACDSGFCRLAIDSVNQEIQKFQDIKKFLEIYKHE